MKNASRNLSRKLFKLYILALTLVALFSIISQALIQYSITQQQNDSRVINIAGRQRMLSQRLCKTSILLANPAIFLPDAEAYSQDLKEILELWYKCHTELRGGMLNIERKIMVKNSATINAMFAALDPVFNIMYTNANIIQEEINEPTAQKNQKIKTALGMILKNERTFLKMMDKIVFQYDKEAQQRITQLKKIELIIFILTIIILFLEGIFIFRPTYIQINQTLKSLTESESEQQTLNEQLKETNISLMRAKEALIKTAEEKFRLQIKEDKIRSASIIEGQEEERKRMALDLHDGIGQMLTGLKLISEKININQLQSEKDQKTFTDLKDLLNETIAETRVISFNLMPSVLNDFGIVSAIKLLIDQTQKNSSILIHFNTENTEERFNKNLEVTLYRICQEAINNVVKHAEASEIFVELFIRNDFIIFNFIDNGKGFDIKKLKTKALKNGIRNIKARAELNNGELKITSIKGKGTKISVKIPLS